MENPSTISIKVNIINKEVIDAIIKLKNNKSSGYDKMVAERMKRLSIITLKQLTDILKDTIDNNLSHQIGLGIIIPSQKTNKPKIVNNTKPIILLSIIRKILSNITQERMRPAIEEYISPSQAAYRQGRSIADVV